MGTINIDTTPPVERDLSLGRYMDAWGQLESILQNAIGEIMGIGGENQHMLFAVIPVRQMIDLFDAAAKFYLNEEGQSTSKVIHGKLIRRNMRRNNIVHGTWQLRVSGLLGFGETSQQWLRIYNHINPDFEYQTDEKIFGVYKFTVEDLDKATGHVRDMVSALWSLAEEIPKLRVRQGNE